MSRTRRPWDFIFYFYFSSFIRRTVCVQSALLKCKCQAIIIIRVLDNCELLGRY